MTENNTSLIMYVTEDGVTRIQATFDQETVWLSIDQMAELFQRDKSVIGKHVRSIFSEGELDKKSVWAKFAYTASDGKTYQVDYYNLDVIISVGYRVKSLRGTQFRIWANGVLKDYLLKGYAVNQRIERLENRVSKTEEKIDFFVRTSLPPVEGIFFQGQIFDAYAKFESFIQSAEQEIILIDNYIDISVLERFSKKQKDVKVTIYTDPKTKLSKQDIQKFNEQYSQLIIEHTSKAHDRFLIIDNKILYHIGASLKDLGKKCFAFEIMDSAWIKEILKNL
jgi:hypothetical protein